MKDVIKNLISQKEKLHLEFKQEWYWKDAKKPTESQWGEFLKDLIALANCNENYVDSNKYLIIGVKEIEEDFEKRIVNTYIEGYTLDRLKIKIIQKVNNFFRTDEESVDLGIVLSYEEFYGKNILIIEIKPIQSLIVLSKDLKVKNRTEKKNCVFIRSLKEKGDPEVINASPEHIELIKRNLLSLKTKRRKEKSVGRSVEKTINSFVNGNSAFSLDNPRKSKNEVDLTHNKILFEVFPVKSSIQNINIIYIFDQTNQIQTYDYLIKKRIISSDSTNFVLIDNGLKKDIGGIKKKFHAKEVYTLDEFALEYLYKDHLGEDIYHDGNFKKQRQIKNFIEPYTENSGDESALSILSNWFKKDSRPLMVLKGYGGVGKTTLVKYFLDALYQEYKNKSEKSKILFIDSKKIVDEIAKEGSIDNIFPFYEAYVKLHSVSNSNRSDPYSHNII